MIGFSRRRSGIRGVGMSRPVWCPRAESMVGMQVVPRPGGGEVAEVGAAEQVTEAWLANRRLSEHTRAAYRRDVAGWLAWCAGRGVEPLQASFLDVNAYARGLEDQ